MTKKRNLYDELMEGVEAMRQQREGKVTLRTHEVEELPPLQIDADLIRETRESLSYQGLCSPAIYGFLSVHLRTGNRVVRSPMRKLLRSFLWYANIQTL